MPNRRRDGQARRDDETDAEQIATEARARGLASVAEHEAEHGPIPADALAGADALLDALDVPPARDDE